MGCVRNSSAGWRTKVLVIERISALVLYHCSARRCCSDAWRGFAWLKKLQRSLWISLRVLNDVVSPWDIMADIDICIYLWEAAKTLLCYILFDYCHYIFNTAMFSSQSVKKSTSPMKLRRRTPTQTSTPAIYRHLGSQMRKLLRHAKSLSGGCEEDLEDIAAFR